MKKTYYLKLRHSEFYKANARPHQRIGAMIDKMGFDEFKAAVLGEHAEETA